WAGRVIVSGIDKPVNEIPENLLGILGFSVGTSLGAKAITTSYVNEGVTRKPPKSNASGAGVSRPARDLLADDSGIPELAKIQMFLFTLVAVIFFLILVGDRLDSGDKNKMVLPDVDQSLLILMGISSGG